MEDTFIKIGKGEGAGNEKIYKLNEEKPYRKFLVCSREYAFNG